MRKVNPELVDAENSEWTDEMFTKAKRGPVADKRSVGHPKAEIIKVQKTLRLSPEVIDYFQSTGSGWQTRMDEALLEYVRSHR